MANFPVKIRRIFRPAVFAALALAAQPAHARENPYDIFAKVIAPIVKLFAATEKTGGALAAEFSVENAADEKIAIALQCPDRLILRVSIPGEQIALCRNAQEIWAFPGGKMKARIGRGHLPEADPDFQLAPFRLPVPEKQLVFLPALFQVGDAGDETVGGENCRVLDVSLMPDLARSLRAQEWSARLWVGENYRPVKIEVRGPKQHLAVLVKKLDCAPALPDSTWQPAPDEASDILRITPPQFKQLLDALALGLTTVKQPK
jgi:hypothetical protein